MKTLILFIPWSTLLWIISIVNIKKVLVLYAYLCSYVTNKYVILLRDGSVDQGLISQRDLSQAYT